MPQRCKTWIFPNVSVSFQASGSQGEHLKQKLYYCKSLGSLEKLLTLNLWELFCLWTDSSLCFLFLTIHFPANLCDALCHTSPNTQYVSPLWALSLCILSAVWLLFLILQKTFAVVAVWGHRTILLQFLAQSDSDAWQISLSDFCHFPKILHCHCVGAEDF